MPIAGSKRIAFWLGTALLAGCAERSAPPGSARFKAEPPTGPYADVGSLLDSRVEDGTLTGYSFVLVDRDGPRYERSLGVDAEGREFTGTLPVPIASAGKAPAAAAILSLVDRRLLDLDRPIHQYLAGTPVEWPRNGTLDRKADITMRMLLSHTSGLPGFNETPPCVANPDYPGGLEACVAFIASNATPLRANPGSVFIYGGTSFQVAGYVAQVVAGAASWQEFFGNALALPLDSAAEFFYEEGANPRVGGGALASAQAYGRFLRMMLRGGLVGSGLATRRVVSGRSAAELSRNQLVPPATAEPIDTYSAPNSYTPYALAGSSYPHYGLGFFIEAAELYQTADYYSPGPEVSDQGLFGATPWIDFGLGYAAMLLIEEPFVAPPPAPDTPAGADPEPPATASQKSIALWNELRPLLIRHYSTGN